MTAAAAAALPRIISSRIQRAITPPLCTSLLQNGYAIVDNIFGADLSHTLRDELVSIRNHMHVNNTHLVVDATTKQLVPKSDIFEAELLAKDTQALAPLCAQLQHDSTLRVMLSVIASSLSPHLPLPNLTHQAIKLQYNRGGCFPMHFDSDADIDGRFITCIWYLNPNWSPGDGGELRLYPFPASSAITIAPLHDRMVLFQSRSMLHRVLPSLKDRYCFTIWLSTHSSNSSAAAAAPPHHHHHHQQVQQQQQLQQREREASRQILTSSTQYTLHQAVEILSTLEELRKHAVKYVYREEWERSLRESHPGGAPATEAMVQRFHTELKVIERALGGALGPALEEWRRRYDVG